MSKKHHSDEFDEVLDAPTGDAYQSADTDTAADDGVYKPAADDDASSDELDRQVADLTQALQRERADAVNLRRRHEEQIANLKTTVKASVVRELLPVIDNLERALKHVPKDLEDNDFVKGVQGLVRQFEKTLHDLGVQKIKTVGEPFDPQLHDAVSMEDGDGEQEIVSEELQAGYQLGTDGNAEVLRPAMVRVKAA